MASNIHERLELIDKYYEGARIEMLPGRTFDRMLSFTIPGDPVSDGRPRENKKLQIFYNAKKEFLRKIFAKMYGMDPILQKLCIITPHRIEIKAYSLPTSKEAKYLSTEEIDSETIMSIGNKDNDNVEKVNWDILQDSMFMIILNDSSCVNNETFKYYSFKPRTVINVYYSTTFTNRLYEQKITSSMEYKFYLCSKKYLIDTKRMNDDDIVAYLGLKLIDTKTSATKKLTYLLGNYSASIIDGLFRYYFFDGCKNDFIDIYVRKRNKKYKIGMIANIVCSGNTKRKSILDSMKKDPLYKTIFDSVEKDVLEVVG